MIHVTKEIQILKDNPLAIFEMNKSTEKILKMQWKTTIIK